MPYQLTPYTLPVLAAAVLWAVLATYGWRHRDHPGSKAYIVMMAGGAVYSAGYAAELTVTSLEAKLVLWRIQSIAWEFILPALLLFTLAYAGYGARIDRRHVAALAAFPLANVFVVLLPGTGGLLYRSPELVTVAGDAYVQIVPGPWYHLGTALSYALVAASMAVLLQLLLRVPSAFRGQVATVLAGVAAPVVVDAAFRLYPHFAEHVVPPVVDYLPLTFLFTGVALTVGRYESDLLRRVPVSFDTVMDTIESGIVVLDGEGRVIQANAAAADVLGEAAPTGDAFAAVSDRAAAIADAVDGVESAAGDPDAPAVEGAPAVEAGSHHLRFDDRVVAVRARPIDGPSGGRLGTLLVLRDVTDEVRYDEMLRTHNEQLQLLNQMLRHDIRNDASVALGWAQTLDEELTGIDPEERRYLQTVIDSTNHVIELTDLAAEMTRSFEHDGEALEPSKLDRVLRSEVADARESHPDAEFVVEGQLPSASVAANELLGSVFRNLLKNAVVHNDRDRPRVTVSAERDGDRVRVRVADDGPGIPAGVRKRLFERGAKGEDSAGTGLGLYLVATLVEQFGGAVRAEDNDPRGTVFVVELPVYRPAAASDVPRVDEGAAADPDATAGDERSAASEE